MVFMHNQGIIALKCKKCFDCWNACGSALNSLYKNCFDYVGIIIPS